MVKELKPILTENKPSVSRGIKVFDIFESCLRELFAIRNPQLKKGGKEEADFLSKAKKEIRPIWIYYPWLKTLVKSPPESIFLEIKTSRNKYFILEEEQENYRNLRVGILGMSIGSNIIWPLVASGGPKFLKIADPDIIELSNLNRMFGSVLDIGENKAVYVAKKAYEMDPFLDIEVYPEDRIKSMKQLELAEDFISWKWKVDVLIDEVDDLKVKFIIRKIAKKERIPVLMVTNVGKNTLLDVERYDIDSNYPIFHGLVEDINLEKAENLSPQEWVKIAAKIVQLKHLDSRMRRSVKEVGKTLVRVPQIAPTAWISGALVSFCLMRIANKQKLKSGRYFLKNDRF